MPQIRYKKVHSIHKMKMVWPFELYCQSFIATQMTIKLCSKKKAKRSNEPRFILMRRSSRHWAFCVCIRTKQLQLPKVYGISMHVW